MNKAESRTSGVGDFSGLSHERLIESQNSEVDVLKDRESEVALPHEFGEKKVALHEYGDPNGPVVVALHGWGANGIGQENVFEKLDGYHVYSIDLPGFGKSEPLDSKDCHIERYVDVAGWLTEHLSDGHDIHAFIGHSIGGVIAAKLLVERYETQRRICEQYGMNSPKPLAKKLLLTGAPINGIPDGKILSNPVMGSLMKEVFEGLPKLPASLKKVKDVLDSSGIIDPKNIDDRYIRRDVGTDGWAAVDLAEQLTRQELTQLDCDEVEVAYFHGENDRFTSPKDIEGQAARTGAEAHIYPDAGHDVHYDAGDKIANDIKVFLDK